MPATAAAALFVYAFVSNVALAVIPHEPGIIWYGAQFGIWATAVVATLGTVAASWIDHRAFVPLIRRVAARPMLTEGMIGRLRRGFARAPFAVIAASGLTPLPFFPFKAMAFAEEYPLGRYLAAVAVGRFPRYVLLAWLGMAVKIPPWILVVLFAIMITPTLRTLWKRRNEK